ncbi:uncharacterized protein BT62DRAFT_1010234 [Guyanagaster necrorhizus]|uniref:Uncharacterized protein n=1 Tax=Guyanagaster necrorhizus TaxID=856835 RepID=A0A9P8ANS9_9AGAR|nr:uncharacterized protein BT62DRAFT_1010234 [Guyanagaster necrorhizus MCA 3950]KAG7442623.1 hypothetical protein BT62DRAFT_1010234 [Guyanagaster necrorhizus MCA 3950]
MNENSKKHYFRSPRRSSSAGKNQRAKEARKVAKAESKPSDDDLNPNKYYELRSRQILALKASQNPDPYPHKFHVTSFITTYIRLRKHDSTRPQQWNNTVEDEDEREEEAEEGGVKGLEKRSVEETVVTTSPCRFVHALLENPGFSVLKTGRGFDGSSSGAGRMCLGWPLATESAKSANWGVFYERGNRRHK